MDEFAINITDSRNLVNFSSDMDRFKLIQTSELYSSATSGETRTIAWSHHHQLAMVCTKGLYVMELLPNPTYTSPNLNFKPQFIQRDSGGNPVLDRLGLNVAELANEVQLTVYSLLGTIYVL